jgi:pseudouridine-5'-phosphate glycosidase
MIEEEAKKENTQSKVSQSKQESEGLKTFITKVFSIIVSLLNTKKIQEKTAMSNNEEMKSTQAQSQTNPAPKPPEIPTTSAQAIDLFKQIEQGVIEQGVIGKEAATWVFQGENPSNSRIPIPNPKTKFSEPVSRPPGQL